MQALLGCPTTALISRLSSFAALVHPLLYLYWSKKAFCFQERMLSSSEAVSLCHCSIWAECWCNDVLQGKLFPCGPKEGHGSRAELKARLGLEVAHLIRLPKKGFMEVGYFRMMETSRWFCRKEGVAMRLWSPAANLSPWFCLSGCSTLLTQPSVLRRFKWSVSLHPQRQCCQRLKKVSHGLWQKKLLFVAPHKTWELLTVPEVSYLTLGKPFSLALRLDCHKLEE